MAVGFGKPLARVTIQALSTYAPLLPPAHSHSYGRIPNGCRRECAKLLLPQLGACPSLMLSLRTGGAVGNVPVIAPFVDSIRTAQAAQLHLLYDPKLMRRR
ncbi:hypothetical protein [Pseudoalteromonas xiamenensis]